MGGDIVAPDDLVFDPQGNMYVTEITEGRVSVRSPNGVTRVVHGDMPVANPITFHKGRLLAGECRVGGRIMELDLDRKSVVEGKSGLLRVALGGRRIIKNKHKE